MSECADPSICRDGCCRSFMGEEFCDMESNCLDHPTWIIALVPAALGLLAIFLLVFMLVQLKQRKVIGNVEHMRILSEKKSLREEEKES